MIRAVVLVSGFLLAATFGCGGSSKTKGESPETTPDAGEDGTGTAITGGAGGRGGTAGTAGAARGGEPSDGGEPSEGGAPTGGRGGGGGSSNGGAPMAGAAGAAGVRVPDGCEPGSQHIGEAFCSAEMTCDDERLTVSCSEISQGLWSCICTNAAGRTDYEFPATSGVRTCEVAAKACADPDILGGDETCTLTHEESAAACSIRNTCDRLNTIDGVTLRTRTIRNASCKPCSDPEASCCTCTGDERFIDYRLRNLDLADGCEFLDELCKPDSYDFTGAKTCSPIWDNAYDDGACDMAVQCGQPIALRDGTRLTLAERIQTMCWGGSENRCGCTDSAGAQALTVNFVRPRPDTAFCAATTAACAGLEPLKYTSGPSCSSMTTALPTSCSVDGECVEAASIREADVLVDTVISLGCEQEPSDSWLCRCTHSRETLEVESGDSLGACDQAVLVCPPTPAPL